MFPSGAANRLAKEVSQQASPRAEQKGLSLTSEMTHSKKRKRVCGMSKWSRSPPNWWWFEALVCFQATVRDLTFWARQGRACMPDVLLYFRHAAPGFAWLLVPHPWWQRQTRQRLVHSISNTVSHSFTLLRYLKSYTSGVFHYLSTL